MKAVNFDNNEPIVALKDVGVSYKRKRGVFRSAKDNFWALKKVSFNIYHGEALGIIGRNGAGKSTLLKLIAGIIRPDGGKIINNGFQSSLLSLQVGFIPYLTGRENAVLNGMFLGLKKKDIERKMGDIIAFSELEDFIDEPISSYSTGMKARLGFSVAFQVDPDILLVDEALGVGDAEFRKKSTEVMHKKIRSDKTVVLVSHNVPTIRQLCDRAVWIENGVSQIEGDTETVLKAYENFLKNGIRIKEV